MRVAAADCVKVRMDGTQVNILPAEASILSSSDGVWDSGGEAVDGHEVFYFV